MESIKSLKENIVSYKKAIKKYEQKIDNTYKQIKKLQSLCDHDMEETGVYAGIVLECRKCGFIGGC